MGRPYCKECRKPEGACICHWVEPIDNQTRVVILQHPDEVKKVLGTALIASLCLANVERLVGVDFSSYETFHSVVTASHSDTVLLYPSNSSVLLKEWLKDSASETSVHWDRHSADEQERTLVILDGTWRNVREILLSNASLKKMASVKLNPVKGTNYRIRKAPSDESLSTIEAICAALELIEPTLNVTPMRHCFEKMIDYQISRMGDDVYKKNYLDNRK